MNKMIKDSVHPSYIEIIKQLSPDEAKMMNLLPAKGLCEPIVDIIEQRQEREGTFIYFSNFSLLGLEAKCDFPDNTPIYINNLCRLGLAEIPADRYLIEDFRYDKIRESEKLNQILSGAAPESKIDIRKKMFGITDFGVSFKNICV
jgi:hypothetical protein